jgi:hypothetical protein
MPTPPQIVEAGVVEHLRCSGRDHVGDHSVEHHEA